MMKDVAIENSLLDLEGTAHIYYTEAKLAGQHITWKLNHVQHKVKSPAKGIRLPAVLRTKGGDDIVYIIDKNGKEKDVKIPR